MYQKSGERRLTIERPWGAALAAVVFLIGLLAIFGGK